MNVYMIGAVYFNGCADEEKRAFAPDGRKFNPRHVASLWVADEVLDRKATTWWPYHAFWHPVLRVTEFRIPEPVRIVFPDGPGFSADCHTLERTLPKLHKEKGGVSKEFTVNPKKARTIAEMAINSGYVKGGQLQDMTLAQWTIDRPAIPITITVVSQKDPKDSRQIALEASAAAEIVFSNSHHLLTETNTEHARQYRGHAGVFKQLNPDGMTVVAKPAVELNPMTIPSAFLNAFAKICQCSDNPCCCKTGGHPHGPKGPKGGPRKGGGRK